MRHRISGKWQSGSSLEYAVLIVDAKILKEEMEQLKLEALTSVGRMVGSYKKTPVEFASQNCISGWLFEKRNSVFKEVGPP